MAKSSSFEGGYALSQPKTDNHVNSTPSHHSHAQSAHSSDTLSPETVQPVLPPDSPPQHDPAVRHAIFQPQTQHPDFEVTLDHEAENPKKWPAWYRLWSIFVVSSSCWVVVLYSTTYTSTIPGLMEEFDIESKTVATIGLTTYLLGLALGSLVVAPLSELYGRRPVYLVCTIIFVLLVLPCAMATSLEEILICRFFGALFGSALLSNSTGTVVDVADEHHRALYVSFWSIAPLNGPVAGPLIGGFVYEYLGWRWDNWLVMILGGAALLLLLTVKETYGPTILRQKAARMRKETGDSRWWCRHDQQMSKMRCLGKNLSRPLVLSFTEPILWFFNIWIALTYGILYLCFVAYPIIFTECRGWGPGLSGLSFLGIGIGNMVAVASEPLCRRLINAHPKDPETGRPRLEATASIMAIGAILTPIGQLVFSWTSLPTSIHWAIPMSFGILFGAGNTLSFIYSQNYLGGAYGIYSASAFAGNAVMRSLLGGTLPLAGPTMYTNLTPQWAGTLLGLLEVCMIPVPIAFYKYGKKLRARSRVIGQLRADSAKEQQGKQQTPEHKTKAAAAAGMGASGVVERDVERF
ncbi:hypothetical protein NW756_000011 [Fusarium oxysporum]|nr:hypothetical protein NW753_014424 [Fusarium oxysporum]KAJ4059404.1 hypothetical protein NW763_006837 [Fusarium oxysporum]KAJ4104254.1 hypothetical protein NW756_000011 [Fusarium oxysporum]WKT40256.1 MFS transporter superfamily [Fusarium oxysporum f. sp. vasinfectum]